MSNLKFQKGFTLLEVLIATSIFAMVMIMTTGVIAQSTGYQTKTKAMSDTSEEAGRISDAIARDLKLADGWFNVQNLSAQFNQFKNGVALTNSSGFVNYSTPMNYVTDSAKLDTSHYLADTLLISTKDKIIIYTTKTGSQNIVYSRSFDKNASFFNGSDGWWTSQTNTLSLKSKGTQRNLFSTYIFNNSANIISTSTGDSSLDTQVAFGGYTASNAAAAVKAQSYIAYYVHSLTKDFATLPPTSRSETFLRSMVTVRNYSNK